MEFYIKYLLEKQALDMLKNNRKIYRNKQKLTYPAEFFFKSFKGDMSPCHSVIR